MNNFSNYFSLCLSFLFVLMCLSINELEAQDKDEYVQENYLRYDDFIYKDHIKTVTLFPKGYAIGYPIISLNGLDKLVLSFDDMNGDVEDYSYTVIHCNSDWQPSDLNDMEYIEGFNTNEILTYDYAFNTLVDFTNYQLEFPNDDMKLTKSGNYLLKVFMTDDEEELVLTKRFMIHESQITINANVLKANAIRKGRTHQEIDFTINHPGQNIRSPRSEVKVFVLQNGRWDNMIKDLEPLFIKENQLIYDFQDEIVFPGGKEFMVFDLRSTRFLAENIKVMDSDKDRYYMALYPDSDRTERAYVYDADANGQFFIDNHHEDDANVQSDYINTTFTLMQLFPDREGDFYVYGGLTNWQLKDEYKMRYDEEIGAYQCTVDLKQGYYNYSYAYVKNGTETVDLSRIEGDWYQTENNYQILVYYRPFGERYDKLVGYHLFNSLGE